MHTYTYIHMHTHNKYACMHIYTQVHTYCDSHLFYTNVAIYIAMHTCTYIDVYACMHTQ